MENDEMTLEEAQEELAELKGKPGRKSKETTARIAELEAAIAAALPEAATTEPEAPSIPEPVEETKRAGFKIYRVKRDLHPSARAGIVCPFDEETPEGLAWWEANHPRFVAEIYE